jgi:hypothetical protein
MSVYLIETKKEIFWSNRKLDRDWKHATEFLYRDRAKAKEITEERFKKLKNNTPKKLYEIIT